MKNEKYISSAKERIVVAEKSKSLEQSPNLEKLKQQIILQAANEGHAFKEACLDDLTKLQSRAELSDTKLTVSEEAAFGRLNESAVSIKEELLVEVDNIETAGVKNEDEGESAKDFFKNVYDNISDKYKYLTSKEEEELLGNLLGLFKGGQVDLTELFSDDKMALKVSEVLRHFLVSEKDICPNSEMSCAKCAAEVASGAGFCNQCGKKLEQPEELEDIFKVVASSLAAIDSRFNNNGPADAKIDDNITRERNNLLYIVSKSLHSGDSVGRIKISDWLLAHQAELTQTAKIHKLRAGDDDVGATHDHIGGYTLANIISKTENSGLLSKALQIATTAGEGQVEVDINALLRSHFPPHLKKRKNDIVGYMLESHGISRDIITKWDKAKVYAGLDKNEKKKFRSSLDRNLSALQELDALHAGAGHELYRKFGIANFARYNPQILIRQLEMEDKDVPYGVVVYPEADHNGAFFQDREKLAEIGTQLQAGGYEMRIIEAASQLDMARRLNRLNHKYSPIGHKMDFIILGGHGSKSSVQLGEAGQALSEPPPIKEAFSQVADYEKAFLAWQIRGKKQQVNDTDRSSLDSTDLEEGGGKGVRRAASKWLDSNAPIVFFSCSTGIEGGVAQTVSSELSLNTIAPDRPTSVQGVEVSFNEQGKPVFDVEYSEAEEYGRAETKQYIAKRKEYESN